MQWFIGDHYQRRQWHESQVTFDTILFESKSKLFKSKQCRNIVTSMHYQKLDQNYKTSKVQAIRRIFLFDFLF